MSTEIAWTDETWNPTVGCSRVSPGCDHCYAITVAARQMQSAHAGLTWQPTWGRAGLRGCTDWTGEVRLLPERLATPLSWRKPRRVFVDSMSDLFHPAVPMDYLAHVFGTMAYTPQHTYQVLTKRPKHMWRTLSNRTFETMLINAIGPGYDWPLPNVWLGTSVETQEWARRRVPELFLTPAAVRFLSVEPLLEAIDLGPYLGEGPDAPCVDWVIVGGESGPGHRTMEPTWAEKIARQCEMAGVPLFVKQDSGPKSGQQGRLSDELWSRKAWPDSGRNAATKEET